MATHRTIRVTGLPVDIPENRLIDKIQIHFLRKKNGGGDIHSVSVCKVTPGTVFITFEEPEVALRLAQRGNQIFKINERSYNIHASLHNEEVDPDEVLLEMAVTVDLSKLPDGKQTLLSLHKRFPGVVVKFEQHKELCAIKGLYSEVQALSSMVLGSLPTQNQSKYIEPLSRGKNKEKQNLLLKTSANKNLQNEEVGESRHAPSSKGWDQSLKTWKSDLVPSHSNSHQALNQTPKQDVCDLGLDPGTLFEDFSLIVDSDIFRYLHKHCSKDYESVLTDNGVEVLEVNCGDIITLYLKPNKALSEHGLSSVKKAHQGLALLYQEKESQLRKEHVSKREIQHRDLDHALESLRLRLPLLMIDEDEENVFMVGGKRDVSEAKQYIVERKGFGVDYSDPFASSKSTFALSEQDVSTTPEQSDIFKEQESQFNFSDHPFSPNRDSQKSVRRHHTSELGFSDHPSTGLFTFPTEPKEKTPEDIFVRRHDETSEARPSDLKRMANDDKDEYATHSLFAFSKTSSRVLDQDTKPLDKPQFLSKSFQQNGSKKKKSTRSYKSKPAESGSERKMAANFSNGCTEVRDADAKLPQEPKTASRLPIAVSPEGGQPHSLPFIKPSMKIHFSPKAFHGSISSKSSSSRKDILILKDDMKTPGQIPSIPAESTPTSLTAHFTDSLGHKDLSEDKEIKANPFVPLKRSNSFSGRSKSRPGGQTDAKQSSKTCDVYTVDLAVSCKLWLYVTSVYKTEMTNLTRDLQLQERFNKIDMILCLSGRDREKVNKCHHSLKSLVDKVSLDFHVRNIPLSMLGVSHSKDQTLADLCIVLKKSCDMVHIIVMPISMTIMGPKLPCEMVEATLMEVFCTGPITERKTSCSPTHSDSVTVHQGPSKVPNKTEAHAKETIPQTSTVQTRDTKRDSIANEQGIHGGIQSEKMPFGKLDIEEGGTKKEGSDKVINKADCLTDGEPTSTTTSQVKRNCQNKASFGDQVNPKTSADHTRDFSAPHEVHQSSKACETQDLPSCYRCQKQCNTARQRASGSNLCSRCEEDLHTVCKFSRDPIRGIRGTMTIRELAISIPGYLRDTTLKIIYDVPDGIQGDAHPCPGAPFKGRRFEAFLPNNESTKRLLPRLEKAFHKGLTFTVKAKSSEEGGREGMVVWGSIPHKTRTDGGSSRNGYPDSSYIKRLTEALNVAETEE